MLPIQIRMLPIRMLPIPSLMLGAMQARWIAVDL